MSNYCVARARNAVLVLVFSAATRMCFGQSPLIQGTPVIGQCLGHEGEPGCVLPNLFGPTGLTLVNNPTTPHYAHFLGSAQTTLNQTLSTAIATQLAILPLISPASGFTYKYDSAAGAFTRSTSSFGPIYSERAETIGRGGFSFGVSYQRFRFQSLDGIDLRKVPAVFSHVHTPTVPPPPYLSDVISTTNSIDLKMDQTLLYGTVGITDRIDLSVAIPIATVRMGATSAANIIRVSGSKYTDASGVQRDNPHEFDLNGSLYNSYTSNGSASGIGDVTIRGKASILQRDSFRMAFAVDVRTPTGNARQLLGSGAVGVKPFLIISGGRRLSPHLNAGYQWNGSSILAGDVTGTSISDVTSNGSPQITNGPAKKFRLPNQAFYSLGADFGATRKLTLAFDYLAQILIDTPRVFRSNFNTASIAGGTGALALPTISAGKDTIALHNGAVGLKYNLFGKLLLTADILFRMDNKGLRQNVTPLVALSYAFGQ